MKSFYVNIPKLIPVIYNDRIWNFSSKRKNIYLTFDDGPTPIITDWVLDTLIPYKAKATFFCIGKNIEENSDIFERIFNNGHAIGNHTYEHLKGWNTPNKEYLNSVIKTEELIQNSKFKIPNSKLFRPPYGKIKRSQSKLLIKNNYDIIMWSILSADFDKNIDEDECLNNVIKNAKNGSIVVFHDSVKAFDKLQVVLPKVLKHLSEKGYSFKSITSSLS